jgi:mannan endo-1,4-beta-mannosidase
MLVLSVRNCVKLCLFVQVPECATIFPEWVDEMSTYVKSLDANHLVTVGEEGFFSANEKNAKHNPQKWGEEIGQSFATDHLAANVDFATVHIWPDNWER